MKYISGGDLASRAMRPVWIEKTVTDWDMQKRQTCFSICYSSQANHLSRPETRQLNDRWQYRSGDADRFGIARWVKQEKGGVTAVGTMGYAPPELLPDASSLLGRLQPGRHSVHLLTGSDPRIIRCSSLTSQRARGRQIVPSISVSSNRF
jgi:serine/threonine-protein kinase